MEENILTINNISKVFPGVQALDNIDFTLKKGEIRALVGKNGAGKSTFIKIITGIYNHDEGNLILNGREITQINPQKMYDHGIRAIYQTNDMVPYFTVSESIMLNNECKKWGGLIIDKRKSEQMARDILENQLCVQIDLHAFIRDLDVSQQQLVQIAKKLIGTPRIMIFDEPTAALSAREIKGLFETIRVLKAQGVSIIYVSHRFEEIFDIADSITIFRDGTKVGDFDIKETDERTVIQLMVGEVSREAPSKRDYFVAQNINPVLKVHKLGSPFFKDLSFELRPGEILGIYGGENSGKEKIAQVLFGQEKYKDGWIELEGQKKRIKNTRDAIRYRLGYVPRDRKGEGLIIDFNVRENISMPSLPRFSSLGLINKRSENEVAVKLIADLSIKTPHTQTPSSSLSGGNQQKVVLGRWIVSEPRILLLDYPSSGIDVKAKGEVYSILMRLTESGMAIILVSPEYEEIATLCNRVLVMRDGCVVKEFGSHEFSEHNMLQYAISYSE